MSRTPDGVHSATVPYVFFKLLVDRAGAEVHPAAQVRMADESVVPLVRVADERSVLLSSPRTLQTSPIEQPVISPPITVDVAADVARTVDARERADVRSRLIEDRTSASRRTRRAAR